MRCLLISPVLPPGRLLRLGPASEFRAVRRLFYRLAIGDPQRHLIVADNRVVAWPPKASVVRLSRRVHRTLLGLGQKNGGIESAIDILARLTRERGRFEVICTWGESSVLRAAAGESGLQYISLQLAARGGHVANYIRLNPTGDTPFVPEMLPNPRAQWEANELLPTPEPVHYSRFLPLPADLDETVNGKTAPLISVFVANPAIEGPGKQDVESTNESAVERQIARLMASGAFCLIVAQGRKANRVADGLAQRLKQAHPEWALKVVLWKKDCEWLPFALMDKSQAILSIHSVRALDGLWFSIPAACYGDHTDDWQWLNPDEAWPAEEKKRKQLGESQRAALGATCRFLIGTGFWVPNRQPTPDEFHSWLANALKVPDRANLNEWIYAADCFLANRMEQFVLQKEKPWVEALSPTWEAFWRKRMAIWRRKAVKLRRDPKRFFQDSRKPLLLWVGKALRS